MTWQKELLNQLISHLGSMEDVLGLLIFGSYSQPGYQPNYWSDLDVLVVVKDDKLDNFFPTLEWMEPLGKPYTYSQSSGHFNYTTRVCFENFNRIDFVITTESQLAKISDWTGIPFGSEIKVLFSRSKIIDEITILKYNRSELPSISQEQFLKMVRDFRFKSMLAVYKVVRNDLLIALHLTQDLVRDCCVLGMMIRDRETGTNIHNDGGIGNIFVTQLEATQMPFTSIGILDSIKACNEMFERLAYEWSDNYQENRQGLINWIEKAKKEIEVH